MTKEYKCECGEVFNNPLCVNIASGGQGGKTH